MCFRFLHPTIAEPQTRIPKPQDACAPLWVRQLFRSRVPRPWRDGRRRGSRLRLGDMSCRDGIVLREDSR
jgi:hypothetical protein